MPDISEALRKAYSSNIIQAFQQKKSRLEPRVTIDMHAQGEVYFFDCIGSAEGHEYHDRHGKIQAVDPDHDKVAVFPNNWEWPVYIDEEDKLQMLFDPSSRYVIEARSAYGRYLDKKIMDALYAGIKMGRSASRTVELDTSSIIDAANHDYDKGSGDTGLTIGKLLKAREILADNEADGYDAMDEDSASLTICCTQKDINHLLTNAQATSSEYVGQINSFLEGRIKVLLGFAFRRMGKDRLKVPATGELRLPVFHRDAVVLAKWRDLRTEIHNVPERRNAALLRVCCSVGASRLNNNGVVMIDVTTT